MMLDDEFALLEENASDAGLAWKGRPLVRREHVHVAGGRQVSALRWGSGPAELVLLHGGAQNAHTWDTLALALERPLLAIDLPGHGHSSWHTAEDGLTPASLAIDVAAAIEVLAPAAHVVAGMSLGGLTAIVLAARRPDLVRRLVIIDVTPGVTKEKAASIHGFVTGPERFDSFDQLLERTIRFNPTRTISSLRRGVAHNAVEEPDGSWRWRHQVGRGDHRLGTDPVVDFTSLWPAMDELTMPVLLVLGDLSPIVAPNDEAEVRHRVPGVRVTTVGDAGHSIQGDQPLALGRILADELDTAIEGAQG